MSFQESNIEHIKVKKSIISSFDLLSMKYVGINIVKARKIALLAIVNKYTITPIKNILAKSCSVRPATGALDYETAKRIEHEV